MANEMKILEFENSNELTTALNKHLAKNWKIAGNSYKAVCKSPGKVLYSILIMRYVPELDPRPAPPTTELVGTPEAYAENERRLKEYEDVLAAWEARQPKEE